MTELTPSSAFQQLIFLGVVLLGAFSGYQSLGLYSEIRADRSAFVKRISPEADRALGELNLIAIELEERSTTLAQKLRALDIPPSSDSDYLNLMQQLSQANNATQELQAHVDRIYLAHEKKALAADENVTTDVAAILQRGREAARKSRHELDKVFAAAGAD